MAAGELSELQINGKGNEEMIGEFLKVHINFQENSNCGIESFMYI